MTGRRARVLREVPYGPHPSQVGDLHLPDAARPPAVCLFHGGFWRVPYGRDQMTPLAEDLVTRGFAVWNLEYRRLGDGGGWSTTFEDVAAGVDRLASLAGDDIGLDLGRVAAVGHSAGGHLALWSAGGRKLEGVEPAPRVRVVAAVGQAAVADLERAHDLALGRGVAAELLGGSPAAVPERYGLASPRHLAPLGVPQFLVHGESDDVVPVEMAVEYVAAARAAGDDVALLTLEGVGHFEHLDPAGEAWGAVASWLEGTLLEGAVFG